MPPTTLIRASPTSTVATTAGRDPQDSQGSDVGVAVGVAVVLAVLVAVAVVVALLLLLWCR